MEEGVIEMDWNDISLEGRWKLIRWLRKRNRNHQSVCFSRIVKNAPNEKQLLKTIANISKMYNAQEALRASLRGSEVLTPVLDEIIEHESTCEGVI